MTDDIGLRSLLVALWDARYRIGGAVAVAVGVVGLVSAFILPDEYRATAQLVVVNPSATTALDSRFNTNLPDSYQLSYAVYDSIAQIALSDEILRAVIDSAGERIPRARRNLEEFRRLVTVERVGNANVIQFQLDTRDPLVSRDLTNTWVTLAQDRAQAVFLPVAADAPLTSQLTAATERLQNAQAARTAFETQDDQFALGTQRDALQRTYETYTEQLRQIDFLLSDITALQSLLRFAEQDNRPALADQLSALNLQLVALSLYDLPEAEPFPLEVTLTDTQLYAAPDADALSATLGTLADTLTARRERLGDLAAPLPEEIRRLQTEITRLILEEQRLDNELTLAREVYDVVSRRAAELTVSDGLSNYRFEIAAQAVAPLEPVRPSPLANALVAGVAVLLGGVAFVFFRLYWNTPLQS